MIRELTLLNWLSLFISLILFSGPGLLILQINTKFRNFNLLNKLFLAFCFSISIISLIFSLLRSFDFGLSRNFLIFFFLLSWVIYILRERQYFNKNYFSIDRYQIFLVFVIVVVLSLIIISLRNVVTGLGSDSYHHTLISQLILDNGKVPGDYLPYAPMVSFSYHFGFHALSAVISALSGIELRLMIPILGTIIVGFSSLSVYFLSHQFFKNQIIAFIAGILTICVGVSPFYLVNYSRFPQLLGLVLCGCLIGLFIYWKELDYTKDFIPFLTLITLGQAFSHYRVTIISIIGIFIYLSFSIFKLNKKQEYIKNNFSKWFQYGMLTLLAFTPWIVQVFVSKQNGVPGDVGVMENSFYSLDRLGNEMIHYPSNIPIGVLFLLSIVIVILKKEYRMAWLYAWIILLLIFSSNLFLGIFMDTVSVIFSLYLPLFVIISWAIYEIFKKLSKIISYPNIINYLFFIPIFYFMSIIPAYINPEFSFVTKEDLYAYQWIIENTTPKDKFIVNTFNFDFNENYIIGIDSGYWLPLLGKRETVSIPMIYIIEQLEDDTYLKTLISIHNMKEYTNEENVKFLYDQGFTHIFLGKKGSKNILSQLEGSKFYNEIYNNSGVFIYEINY